MINSQNPDRHRIIDILLSANVEDCKKALNSEFKNMTLSKDGYFNNSHVTILLDAVQKNANSAVVQFLLDNGCKLNDKDSIFGNSALMFACLNLNVENVEVLLAAEADIKHINSKNKDVYKMMHDELIDVKRQKKAPLNKYEKEKCK